jgi:pyrroline-5-carboxylate reductase
MIEAMADAGNKLGLSEVDSMKAAKKVLVGAAAMVVKMGDEPKILRQNVTSPNGTTFAALEVLAKRNFSGVVYEAMKAARDRSAELGE